MSLLEPERGKPHHSYLRRKRCLRYSADEIARTLSQLCRMRQETKSQEEIKKIALAYAQNVEAACTKSRTKMSNEDYRAQIELKTRTLCNALIKQMAPALPGIRYQQQILPQPLYSYMAFPMGIRPPTTAVSPAAKVESKVSSHLSQSSGSSDGDGMMSVKMTLAERSNDDLFVAFTNDFSGNERDDELYIFQ